MSAAITNLELYELYADTISRCTGAEIQKSDEELEYDIFEEFDVGAHSFFHDDTLSKLRGAGMINDEMVELSRRAHTHWLELQKREWTTDEVRTRPEWRELFGLCDRLHSLILSRDHRVP